MTLNNKKFKTKENKVGLASDETIFDYSQSDKTIIGKYSGGKIKEGFILGKQVNETKIELLYHCLTVDGELLAGESSGTLVENEEGLMEIKLDWNWLNGDKSGGKSHYIEIK